MAYPHMRPRKWSSTIVELESADVKGKTESVRVFRPLTPRARFGTDLTRTHTSPFVGREIDLALLKGIFEKTVASDSLQLVRWWASPALARAGSWPSWAPTSTHGLVW